MPGELGPLLGAGKEAEVYVYGDLALKLYRQGRPKTQAFREAAILAIVERSGLPVPQVASVGEFDGRWGLVMTRAEGEVFAAALMMSPPSQAHLTALAELHNRVHAVSGVQLPTLKGRLSSLIRAAALLDGARQSRMLALLDDLPDGDRLCHGDYHPLNVLGTPGQATVIDWLDAGCGAPAADVCRSYVLISQVSEPMARLYVETYSGIAGLALDDIWPWRPVVAAARLAENVPEETERLLALVDS